MDRRVGGARVGYTRVSTVAQTLDQQNAALEAAGVTKTFSDTMSGARDDRPGLTALLDYVRPGDTVVVWKLDRLGRNMIHILQTVKEMTDQGITLVSTTDGIDSSTAAGRMMIGVLGSLAEYERELTKERTALKREAARKNGARFGRPRKINDAKHIATAKRMKAHGQGHREIPRHKPRISVPLPHQGRRRLICGGCPAMKTGISPSSAASGCVQQSGVRVGT
ncbi:MAG: recombinase family protein [Isosphaeraceae bacterium]